MSVTDCHHSSPSGVVKVLPVSPAGGVSVLILRHDLELVWVWRSYDMST